MLTRRTSLLAPWLLAACGDRSERTYAPLRYDYLTPLQLNVASLEIEQRFVPSGVPPDVSRLSPVPPLQALRAMAEDRLKPLGAADLAIFVILDASLVRRRDTLSGSFAVEVDVYNAPGQRSAYAQASVNSTFSGDLDDLRSRLYDMTRDMMDRMNVEFEFQVRRSLGRWILPAGATQVPVQQQPLDSAAPLPPR